MLMDDVIVLSLGKNILGGYYCFPCFTASIRYYIYVMFSLLQAWWSTCTDCAQVPFCFSLEENVCCRPYSGEILCFHQGKNSERLSIFSYSKTSVSWRKENQNDLHRVLFEYLLLEVKTSVGHIVSMEKVGNLWQM